MFTLLDSHYYMDFRRKPIIRKLEHQRLALGWCMSIAKEVIYWLMICDRNLLPEGGVDDLIDLD